MNPYDLLTGRETYHQHILFYKNLFAKKNSLCPELRKEKVKHIYEEFYGVSMANITTDLADLENLFPDLPLYDRYAPSSEPIGSIRNASEKVPFPGRV